MITAYPDREEANKLAKLLVEQRLAAGVQMFPMESVYRWRGKICEAGEISLHIKSRGEFFDRVAAVIRENHPYEVPEIVRIPIVDGLPAYLEWIGDCTE